MHTDWLLSSPDALAARIPDGAKVAIGADYTGVAMETTRALIRRRARNLHLVCVPVSGLQAELLIGAGCVATIETSAVTLGEFGTAFRFQDALRRGTVRILDATCPAIHAALEAGRKNIPFMPLRGIIGSDLLAHRPDWKVIANPFAADDPIVALPAIRPDVTIFHAPFADRDGNIFIGRRRELANTTQATVHGALVTVEEVRDVDLMASEETAAGALPALYVQAVAVAPHGAAPIGLWDLYGPDEQHFAAYAELARTPEGFGTYLRDFVFEHELEPA